MRAGAGPLQKSQMPIVKWRARCRAQMLRRGSIDNAALCPRSDISSSAFVKMLTRLFLCLCAAAGDFANSRSLPRCGKLFVL